MADFTFRVRFRRSPTDTVSIDEASWRPSSMEGLSTLELVARPEGTSLREATEWVLRGSGWESQEDAAKNGERFNDAIGRALARLRIGVDRGARAAKGAFFRAGLEMLEAQTGRKVLNDTHGLMVYPTEPKPMFAAFNTTPLRTVSAEQFTKTLTAALANPEPMSSDERLASELFGLSSFQPHADSRFLLLMIALEAQLAPRPRPDSSRGLVESFIDDVERASLPQSEKDSLRGSLRWLLNESIGQAGRRKVRERLGQRTYADLSPEDFFTHCYQLRSQLVHGADPPPAFGSISAAAGGLEMMVGDLLSGSLLALA